MSKLVRIQDDLLHELGHPKDVNAALRVRLGLPAREPPLKKSKPKLRAKKIYLDELQIGETKSFQLCDHKWEKIQRLGYLKNKPVQRFAFWRDQDHAYVRRLK